VLRPLGLSVVGAQCRTHEELKGLVHDADYVLTQFAPVGAEVIAAMKQARVIVRYGIGVDNVDLGAARDKGIPVCNVPDFCIDEVADHTLGLILAATRQVVANADHVRQGQWGLAVPLTSMLALKRMTVGVIGFGRIGREVAERLRPFKCRLLVFDPAVDAAEIDSFGGESVGLEPLFAASDLVTLHCPATPKTRHLINEASISRMKDGAILVNAARGSVVCTDDLVKALESGKISFAALDVAEVEPPTADDPLRTMPNVILHSHIASASQSAVTTLRREAASVIACAERGEPLPNIVNGVVWNSAAGKRRSSSS
jgi:D-3-phosphoglycerate dehydrogenase